MTDTPLVSIIIPVYNAEKYIAETINSALNQTWPNKEIIIIDDGSTDKSLSIAKQYERDSIKVFDCTNKGASAARNYGLLHANGQYIQFLDADDLLSPDKIESQLNKLGNFPDHLGLCTTIHFQDGTDPFSFPVNHEWIAEGTDDPADFLIKLYGGSLIGPQYGGMIQPNCWLTPRHLIEKAGLWNEARCPDDDGEFFCRIILASKGIKYSFEGVNYYRKFQNEKSLSGQKSHDSCNSILKATDLKATYLLNHTIDAKAKLALSRLYWENAFSFYPVYKELSAEAEQKARKLAPDFRYRPFTSGIKEFISLLAGWKMAKFLQFIVRKQK